MARVTTQFYSRPRRGDPNAAMVVWLLLQQLRDALDSFVDTFFMGSATMAAATNVVTVTHNAGTTSYINLASPRAATGGNWWIAGQSATQFVIHSAVNAPAGGVVYDWLLKVV